MQMDTSPAQYLDTDVNAKTKWQKLAFITTPAVDVSLFSKMESTKE